MSVRFGQRLWDLMDAREMTGAELARRVGKHRSAVSNWLSGRVRPDPETITQIANVFGVDAVGLMHEAGYLSEPTGDMVVDSRRAALMAIVRDNVPDEHLTALERMLSAYRTVRKFRADVPSADPLMLAIGLIGSNTPLEVDRTSLLRELLNLLGQPVWRHESPQAGIDITAHQGRFSLAAGAAG